MTLASRRAAHSTVSAALTALDDRALSALLDDATPVGVGIGGATSLLQVKGIPVFVKRVRLTDLERLPENRHSTANLFDLPMFCHYGVGTIGGPGFGAWRELAVHRLTTGWVLAGDHEGFPLTYHWRALPDAGRPLPDELADVERAVASWGGGAGIRRRIEALEGSTASIVLFLEHIPHTLHDWLDGELRAGADAAERACSMVADELRAGISFMNGRGLLHLDAHFQNILTDGERLFFADYGLALSDRFELSDDERTFHEGHHGYDRAYAATHLVSWLTVALYGVGPEHRRELVREYANGTVPDDVPAGIAALLARHAPVAAVMGDFYRRFRRETWTATYPRAAVARHTCP